MNASASVFCLECDHEHVGRIVRGQFADDDYLDTPEECEECGADLADCGESDESLRASERRQMGIA